VRQELGGEEAWRRLVVAARQHELGLILDVVPNHMGLHHTNRWWWELLEHGPGARSARIFDVDWTPLKDELLNRVLLPVLAEPYGVVLERGELLLVYDEGAFELRYFDHQWPIGPRSVPRLLLDRIEWLEARCARRASSEDDDAVAELRSIATQLGRLPPPEHSAQGAVEERLREAGIARRRLNALATQSALIRTHLDETVRRFNGIPGQPESFDLLHALLEVQAYRIAHYRVAGEEINYRRFFDICTLGAIRVEDDQVFEETHRLTFRLVEEGGISGLRIDHPDGLYAPLRYLRTLRARCPAQLLIIEKILEPGERIPDEWPVDGTTGYELLAALNGLFVDQAQAARFEALTQHYTGESQPFGACVEESKRLLLGTSLAGELNLLVHRLDRLSERHRRSRDWTRSELRQALETFILQLPIYRTYLEANEPVEPRDRAWLEATLAACRRAPGRSDPQLFDFLEQVLLPERPTPETQEFVQKLQQVTPPVTAKALEDTALYSWVRLLSLNEVGSDPSQFGVSPAVVHQLAATRAERLPRSLNATSTHDTKRSEEVRLRLSALSQLPDEWEALLGTLHRLAGRHATLQEGRRIPSASDELHLWQTLLGVLPSEVIAGAAAPPELVERVVGYLRKAVREAKRYSSWTDPCQPYEQAVERLVRGVLLDEELLAAVRPLARRLERVAQVTTLSQVALKLTLPGLTDVYQGCELVTLSLVDPDNRRPVDWQRRLRLLDELDAVLGAGPVARRAWARQVTRAEGELPVEWADRAKLLLLAEGLRLRRRVPELFVEGRYLPLAIEGPDAHRLFALARVWDQHVLVCVVPRLIPPEAAGGPLALEAWLQPPPAVTRHLSRLVDIVTERRVGSDGARAFEVRSLLQDFPVALLAC
jgi:(1->4)-alpha-D-glucan 1-alpha-D-glucosylmutase